MNFSNFFKALEAFFHALGVMIELAFGRVSWSRPAWMPKLAEAVRKNPREIVGGVLGTVAAMLLLWSGWQWYLHRPHPPEPEKITFEVAAPSTTDYENSDGTPGV